MKGGIIVDWNAIKAEYIAGGTSYRKLAEKYGVSKSTLMKVAAREGWAELRKQNISKLEAKMVDSVSDEQAAAAARAVELINESAMNMLRQISMDAAHGLTGTQVDTYARAIKTLKSVLGIKSDADRREQEARIASLNRQAEKDKKTDTTINIVLGDGEDYSV